MATFESVFPRSDWEAQRLAEANTLFAKPPSATVWKDFAVQLTEHVLADYRAGELEFNDMMQVMLDVTVGCVAQDRVSLLGMTAFWALRSDRPPPRQPGQRARQYPEALRLSAVNLVKMIEEDQEAANAPKLPRRPKAKKQQTVHGRALKILTALRFFGNTPVPAQSTLYKWCLEAEKNPTAVSSSS